MKSDLFGWQSQVALHHLGSALTITKAIVFATFDGSISHAQDDQSNIGPRGTRTNNPIVTMTRQWYHKSKCQKS